MHRPDEDRRLRGLPERIMLGRFPTPLQRLERLGEELGGVEIWMKRDDLSGLGFGGNKVRKLEFLMADAVAKDCDCVLTVGGAQSNHACQTAAAARLLGIEPVLLLSRPKRERVHPTGNLLLEKIMGAEVRFFAVKRAEELEERMRETAASMRERGRRPYEIPLGGSNEIGAAGYATVVRELKEAGEDFDFVFTACGTGGTLAGLAAGGRAFGARFRPVGINVGAIRKGIREKVGNLAREALRLLAPGERGEPSFDLFDGYAGSGYGVPTEAGIDSIKRLARLEGVFLDPVYTSKAMAGLIDLVLSGFVPAGSRALFLHTGGSAALFAYGRFF